MMTCAHGKTASPRLARWTLTATLAASTAAATTLASGSITDPPEPVCEESATYFGLEDAPPTSSPWVQMRSNVARTMVGPPGNQKLAYKWRTSANPTVNGSTEVPLRPRTYVEYLAAWPLPDPPETDDRPRYHGGSWGSMMWPMTNAFGQLVDGYSLAELTGGFPGGGDLAINLQSSPFPGDFLSPGATIAETSLPLVPPGAADAPTSWQGVSRPTLHGVVDLVTGVPLVKETDLELPFDGGTFRLTRTRSAIPQLAKTGLAEQFFGYDRMWDWAGEGWMVGENPILLIDSAMPDVTGDGPRTTWLWLDAHHSIPFQMVLHPANGTLPWRVTYEAPPRFRARMAHNGVWHGPDPNKPGDRGRWQHRPTQYEVWLYDGLLKYTFVAVYDDVPMKSTVMMDGAGMQWPENPTREERAWTSYNDPPFTREQALAINPTNPPAIGPTDTVRNPGFGIPHYGLLVRIDDQNGRSVEITYRDVRRLNVDDPDTDCVETIEDSKAKGEIKHIKLKSGSETRWTLLYSYRRYPGLRFNFEGQIAGDPLFYWKNHRDPTDHPELHTIHGHSVIERVYAYQGDIDDAILAPVDLTQFAPVPAPGSQYGTVGDFSWDADAIAVYNQSPVSADDLPLNWSHQVRHFYYIRKVERQLGKLLIHSTPPILGKTVVRSRQATSTSGSPDVPAASEQISSSLYSYMSDLPVHAGNTWLRAIFRDQEILRARSANLPSSPMLSEVELVTWTNVSNFVATLDAASIRWDPAANNTWSTGPSQLAPTLNALKSRQYLAVDSTRFADGNDPGTSVAAVTIGSRDERRRYRINRLIVPHSSTPEPLSYGLPEPLPLGSWNRPLRSVLSLPYRWQGTLYETSPDDRRPLIESPDLSRSRWISIIDEMPANLVDSSGNDGEESLVYHQGQVASDLDGLKPGQVSRRVVTMNPAGFVLTDRSWQFYKGGVIQSGGGLGEQFIYRSVGKIFSQEPEFVGPNGPNQPPPVWWRPPPIANDAVLVEHRSVGWSALPANQQAAEGLVTYFTHELVREAPAPGTTTPDGAKNKLRVQQVSTGIQRGAYDPPNPPDPNPPPPPLQ